jgi:hypothetical protein
MKLKYIFFFFCFLISAPNLSEAATLSISPGTGVYTVGSTFTAQVTLNTQGKPVNAAEGGIKFNPNELSVVSVDKGNSIFNLWVTEPTFSNSAGTISFSGGLPSGYTGSAGRVFNITFKAKSAASSRVSITNGSVLANDGMGTNVLTSMNGGTFTIQAPSTSPTPEVIEYVAPANTPAAPVITSSTHGDQTAWYKNKNATLSWVLPVDVIAVRTLLDDSASSIPTKVYDTPIKEINLDDLDEGVSYFHIQFKNEDGWGKVSHYRLAVDSIAPKLFELSQPEGFDTSSPEQVLITKIEDDSSLVNKFKIKINNDEAYDYVDTEKTGKIVLKNLTPGYYAVIVEALDEAGNGLVASYSLTVNAFERPQFTEYPSEINEEVIPVIKGKTKPNANVKVSIQKIGAEPVFYDVVTDNEGVFTVIPSGTFTKGVFELSAVAKDATGAESEMSEIIRIAVQQPGYIQIGSFIVNVLSVFIPLAAMVILLIVATFFLIAYFRKFRKNVSVESKEIETVLLGEFKYLNSLIDKKSEEIAASRKTKKLTKAEEVLLEEFRTALRDSQKKIGKEVVDVENLV